MLVHTARVARRRIEVDERRVVQHGVNADAVLLDLDGEWDGLERVTLVISGPDGRSSALPYGGTAVPIPFELMEDAGEMRLTVVGRSGSSVRVVTEEMPIPMVVVPSGGMDGTYEPGDPALDEVQQAIEDARQAAGEARAAAEMIPQDGEPGQVLVRSESGAEWGDAYGIGRGLRLSGGVLSVDAADSVEEDNTLPVTSAAVYVEVGNIEALLATV